MAKEEKKFLLGIDEAGRGCVIGPLVICGFFTSDERALILMGVKDSKKLSLRKREEIYKKLAETDSSRFYTFLVSPQEIDRRKINDICKSKTKSIIEYFCLFPDIHFITVYLDVPTNPSGIAKYCNAVKNLVQRVNNFKIVGENKADETYGVVSAASIVAKVTRDGEIAKLRKIYGDFGSGYPSDPKTKKFLEIADNRKLPIIRQSWKALDRYRYEKIF